MHLAGFLSRLACAAMAVMVVMVVGGQSSIMEHLGKVREMSKPQLRQQEESTRLMTARDQSESSNGSVFLNPKSQKYAVDGTSFPGVPFDIGESYAGLLPITCKKDDPNQIFFWFFPSDNPNATKEVTIWLQGGPGCSSLIGLLQENGPFLWPPGVYQPYPNPFSWSNLTNMVWVDQPYGIGLSQGNTTVKDPIEAAQQFMGFWRNFVEVFGMQGYKINLVGESYGGAWVSYFSDAFLAANDTTNFNLATIQLSDAYFGDFNLQTYVPVIPAVQRLNNIFNLNETFMDALTKRANDCGFLPYYNAHINQFPPAGPLPPSPDVTADCDVLDDFWSGMIYINPCTNPYHIIDVCPFLWTVMGFGSFAFSPGVYFNRSDVQAALHVPPTNFAECAPRPGLLYNDTTPPPGLGGPLPSVVDRVGRTVVNSGGLDFALFSDGALLALQNMTWGGKQGFQTAPSRSANLFVPYHPGLLEIYLATIQGDDSGVSVPFTQNAGAGLLGTTHTERGLTFVNVFAAGHQLPQYSPGAAYRILEFQLGRIESLEQEGDFTTQTGDYTGTFWP